MQTRPSGEADPLLMNAVRHCTDQNILIVAAAGNDGCNCLHIPGALPSVLAVGAMNAAGMPLDFSNWANRIALKEFWHWVKTSPEPFPEEGL